MTEYGQDARLTYSDYLHVPQILREQVCLSEPPAHDELQFIVVHQVYELWFKLVLFELDEVRRRIDAGSDLDLRTAARLCRRVETIFKVLVQQIHVLETMRPVDFLAFRSRLNPASGFQSVQFREVEFVLGMKDESLLERLAPGERADSLSRRLKGDSLPDALYRVLAARGLRVVPPGPGRSDSQRDATSAAGTTCAAPVPSSSSSSAPSSRSSRPSSSRPSRSCRRVAVRSESSSPVSMAACTASSSNSTSLNHSS